MSESKKLFVKYVIAGKIQQEWAFLRDGGYVPDRLGGNLIYALCGAALWDHRIGLLTRLGNGFPEKHYHWLQKNAILDGVISVDELKPKCEFLNYELPLNAGNDKSLISHFVRKGIVFPKELIGLDNDQEVHTTNQIDQPFFDSDIPDSYKYCSILLIEDLSNEIQTTLPMLFRRFSTPYIILNPSQRVLKSSSKKALYSLLSSVNCLIIQEHDIPSFFVRASKDFSSFFELITSFGIETIILKLCDGRFVSFESVTKNCQIIDSYKSAQVDLTGLEGAFNGGFMAGMHLSLDPAIAATYGSVSASVCQENKSAINMLATSKNLLEKRLDYVKAKINNYDYKSNIPY